MNVYDEVAQERAAQDQVFGQQDHDPFTYLSILGEEVGEAHAAAVDARFNGEPWHDYRTELIQVAAVAVAMVEAYDRAAHTEGEGAT